MKIALFTGRFGEGTGTGGVALRLARAWLASGHEVSVWCDHADGELEGVAIQPLGSRWTAAARAPAGSVRLALDRVPGCEVIRASGGVHEAWIRASGGLKGALQRALLSLGPALSSAAVGELALDRAAARQASVIICNSKKVANEVVYYHGLPPERTRVIHTGVDLGRFRSDPELRAAARARWSVPEGGRIALFAGHGFRRKGLTTAVHAFSLAARPEDRLVIAGRDAHASRWMRFARDKLGERLIEAGPLRPIERFLPGADALIHPSRYDASSNTVLEAMACAVPAITSASDGSCELIPDPRLVVSDPEDVQGFASALRYAWESAGTSARCAAAAGLWPETRMASSIENLLMEFVNG